MTMTAVALTLTVIINIIAIITGVVRVSSIIFDLRKGMELIGADLRLNNARMDTVISEVNHTIQMTGVQVQEIRNKVDFLEKNVEKNFALTNQQFTNEVLELKAMIKTNSNAIRDVENYALSTGFKPRVKD